LSLGPGVDDPDVGFPFFEAGSHFLENEKIQPGSAIFLMGPPGTFKEYIASQFAAAAHGATLYVSFKTDFLSTKRGLLKGSDFFDQRRDVPPLADLMPVSYFFDARSPLMTPEEMLFTIRNAIKARSGMDEGPPDRPRFRRAVVWGLRRLYDFPYFGADRALQFLEALVTLLRAHRIVTLLVDWPDSERPSTVPIVDLCQYIFLTRVCASPDSPEIPESRREALRAFWGPDTVEQVAFLRAQRTRDGVQLNQGSVIKRERDLGSELRTKPFAGSDEKETFQYRWLYYGKNWEKDHSLLS
jgi:hypothetical protein